MPHQADVCFSCQHQYSFCVGNRCTYAGCSCVSFEFVPASSRPDSDIVRAWQFDSSSSMRSYTTYLWRQGVYSCNCQGWRTKRYCRHIDEARANPDRPLGSSGGNINASVAALQRDVEAMVSQLNSGRVNDASKLADLMNRMEYYNAFFELGSGKVREQLGTLKSCFEQARLSIINEAAPSSASLVPNANLQQTNHNAITNTEDPFAD